MCGPVGTRGSACRTRCVSVIRVRRTETAVCATTCATGRHTSASTAGTARRVPRSASAAYGTRTASGSGRSRPSTDASMSSAGNASARSDLPLQSSLVVSTRLHSHNHILSPLSYRRKLSHLETATLRRLVIPTNSMTIC